MALTEHTVSLSTRLPGSDLPLEGTWTLRVSADPAIFKDTADHIVFAGRRDVYAVDGEAEFTLPETGQDDLLPGDGRWRLSFVSKDGSVRLGPFVFELTGDMTLDDLAEATGVPVTSSILTQALAAQDAAEASATAATVGHCCCCLRERGGGRGRRQRLADEDRGRRPRVGLPCPAGCAA